MPMNTGVNCVFFVLFFNIYFWHLYALLDRTVCRDEGEREVGRTCETRLQGACYGRCLRPPDNPQLGLFSGVIVRKT